MSDEFNYKMSTRYKPEFKSKLKYEMLYETVNNERNGIEKDSFNAKEIFTRRDSSSIINKLKKQLHLDVKAYASKSDEEKFNVLKLLYFIINTNKYDKYNNDDEYKTISVINLMSKPSLEHTDFANSRYEEHFKSIIEEIRPAVNNPDYREETIERIHQIWKQHHININYTVLEDIQLRNGELQRINQRLKSILDTLDRERICALQRMNEDVIDTFYNMLISSRIIAEIEDRINAIYDYKSEQPVIQPVTNLSLDNVFSNSMEWEDFESAIDINKVDTNNEISQKIWSLIFFKENISNDDLKNIDLSSYRFAKKYAKTITEYWVQESYGRNHVTLGEWIIVIQELMCIHSNKIEYSNCFIRHTNPKVKLTAAIKDFEQISELPRLIILNRLANRMILNFGTKDLFEEKLKADRYIIKIEKIIFSYKNIEDIKTAYNFLYFKTATALTTDFECFNIAQTITEKINKKLTDNGFSAINLIFNNNLYYFLHILIKDQNYRLLQNEEFIEFRKEILKIIADNHLNLNQHIKNNKFSTISFPAYDTTAEQIADEIKYFYSNFYPFTKNNYTSGIMTVPIYYDENNEYYCHIKFRLHQKSNAIEISYTKFIGQDIDSYDIYNQLLLY